MIEPGTDLRAALDRWTNASVYDDDREYELVDAVEAYLNGPQPGAEALKLMASQAGEDMRRINELERAAADVLATIDNSHRFHGEDPDFNVKVERLRDVLEYRDE